MRSRDLATEVAHFSPPADLLTWIERQIGDLASRASQEIRWRDAKNETRTRELAHLRRIRFGVKSDVLGNLQPDLFDETMAEGIAACQAHLAAQDAAGEGIRPPAAKAPRQRAGRPALPEHLPRVEHGHVPASCTCDRCGAAPERIGEDVTGKRSVLPAEFFVERHGYPNDACRPCPTIAAAPAVPSVIDGGLATPALPAWIVVSKDVDHPPLYRLERQAERSGVPLSRSTLAECVGRIGVAVEPLIGRLGELLRQCACCTVTRRRWRHSIPVAARPNACISGLIAATR